MVSNDRLVFVFQYYQAVYSFAARSELECDITEGEMLQVLQHHDLDGNDQWWLVKLSDGTQGYAPANYLYKAEH